MLYAEGRWNKREMTQYRNYMAWIEREGLMHAYNEFKEEQARTPLIFLPELFCRSYMVKGSPYATEEED